MLYPHHEADIKDRLILKLKEYLRGSHDLYLNVALVIPALVVYEVGVLCFGPGVRNGAQVLIQELFLLLGSHGMLVLEAVIIAFAVVCVLDAYRRYDHLVTRLAFLGLECLVYATLLGPLVLLLKSPMVSTGGEGVLEGLKSGSTMPLMLEKVARAMGAGVYEELFFRLMLMAALFHVMVDMLGQVRWVAATVALFVSSVVFSLCHQNQEHFYFYMLAGLILGLLFHFRGFAAVVYTHAFYNLLVFFR